MTEVFFTMWPYNDSENAWLRDSEHSTERNDAPGWPTLGQVEYHRRNAEIIRAEAVGDVMRSLGAAILSAARKLRGLTAKIRTPVAKPGAHA